MYNVRRQLGGVCFFLLCVAGIKLGLLGLMASVFPSQAISPAFEWVLNVLNLIDFVFV